jgi:hypothetical protein
VTITEGRAARISAAICCSRSEAESTQRVSIDEILALPVSETAQLVAHGLEKGPGAGPLPRGEPHKPVGCRPAVPGPRGDDEARAQNAEYLSALHATNILHPPSLRTRRRARVRGVGEGRRR